MIEGDRQRSLNALLDFIFSPTLHVHFIAKLIDSYLHDMLQKPAQLLSRVPRRAWRLIFRIGLALFILPLLLQWVVAYLVGSDARILPPQLLVAKNLLIVTAHPDDECLFFAPSILGVLDRNRGINGGLLVMSTGIELHRPFMFPRVRH